MRHSTHSAPARCPRLIFLRAAKAGHDFRLAGSIPFGTMTRVAPIVPAESDLLCEACGYTLNGLPEDSNCPECGKPIRESIGSERQVPRWEREGGRTMGNLIGTFAAIL